MAPPKVFMNSIYVTAALNAAMCYILGDVANSKGSITHVERGEADHPWDFVNEDITPSLLKKKGNNSSSESSLATESGLKARDTTRGSSDNNDNNHDTDNDDNDDNDDDDDDEDDEDLLESEGEWMVRWADEEGKPLNEYFNERTVARYQRPGKRLIISETKPARTILVGSPPGPESIDWNMLLDIWDYDENPWTPTRSTMVGPLSVFQEMNRALQPKMMYGVVLAFLLIAILMGRIALAKNARIAGKRRQVAQATRDITLLIEQNNALQEDNARGIAEKAALATYLASQREYLESLIDLRWGTYAPSSLEQQSGTGHTTGPSRIGITQFGPDIGLFSSPTEILLRMLEKWGHVHEFLKLELSRFIKTLEMQQEALDLWSKAVADFKTNTHESSPPAGLMPLTDSQDECKKLLATARATYLSLENPESDEHLASSMDRAKQLLLYGLLQRRQMELVREAERNRREAESLREADAQSGLLLKNTRREIERSIKKYIRAARDALDALSEAREALPQNLIRKSETFVKMIDLHALSGFGESLNSLDVGDIAENVASLIAKELTTLSSLLPGVTSQECSVFSDLGELKALGSVEEQQAAESMSAVYEKMGTERSALLRTISHALHDISINAITTAKRHERIRSHGNVVTNSLDTINALRPILAKAKIRAIRDIV